MSCPKHDWVYHETIWKTVDSKYQEGLEYSVEEEFKMYKCRNCGAIDEQSTGKIRHVPYGEC